MGGYGVLRRFARGTETGIAILTVLPTTYLLVIYLFRIQSGPGDDAFFMVLLVLSWLAGFVLGVAVLVRRLRHRFGDRRRGDTGITDP